MDEIQSGSETFDCDVLVIGGGTAGPMAAYKAKVKNPDAKVPEKPEKSSKATAQPRSVAMVRSASCLETIDRHLPVAPPWCTRTACWPQASPPSRG